MVQDYRKAGEQYKMLQEQQEIMTVDREVVKDDQLTKEMRKINPDYLAWILIDGTPISYPIVHSSGKLDYLTHDFTGRNSIYGTLFIQKGQIPFQDANTVIFGHNMKDGSMFAALKNYLNDQWLEEHPYILIYRQGEMKQYEVFSVQIMNEDDAAAYAYAFSKKTDYQMFLNSSMELSRVPTRKTASPDQLTLTLSTCYRKGKRLIVQAQEVLP